MASGEQRNKTVVMGLAGALLRPQVQDELANDVHDLAHIRFHTYGVLNVYATLLAQAPLEAATSDISSLYRDSEECFNQTLVEQAIALVHFGISDNAPPLLLEASQRYFSAGRDRPVRAPGSGLPSPILKSMREKIVTAFKNCLQVSTPLNQVSAFSTIYGLTRMEAKVVALHVSTSQERLREVALAAHAKRDTRIALRALDALGVAERAGADNVEALRAEAERLQLVRETNLARARRNISLALDSLRLENPIPQRRHPPLAPLQSIIDLERAHLPATQGQLTQLRFRYLLLKHAEAVSAEGRLFNLTPVASFSRPFAHFTAAAASRYFPPPEASGKRKRAEAEDLREAAPLLFNPSVLHALLTGPWRLGNSFASDGVSIHFSLVTDAVLEAKRHKTEAARATKALKKAAVGAGILDEIDALAKETKRVAFKVLPDDQRQEKLDRLRALRAERKAIEQAKGAEIKKDKRESAKAKAEEKPLAALKPRRPPPLPLVLPRDATLVGIDTGVRNVCGVAREDTLDKKGAAFTVSTKAFRAATGTTRRAKAMEHSLCRWREIDGELRTAHAAVDDARTKTSILDVLLSGLQARAQAFGVMYAFYGSDKHALGRLRAYCSTQRALIRLVRRIAPKPTDVVVVGDANFGSTMRHLPPGVGGKLVRALQTRLGKRRVVFADEFRSSCLDSERHHYMFHPPKDLAVNETTGKQYIRRVWGLYHSVTVGYTATWDRDCNAARNIVKNFRYKYEHGEMPHAFRRDVKPEAPKSCRYTYRWRDDKRKFTRWLAAAEIATGNSGS